jgi:hypothetical protein
MSDTLRCGHCESLFHRTHNCPLEPKPAPERFYVKCQVIHDEDVYGVVDRTATTLVSGTLTYVEDEAWATADRLNAEEAKP